MRRACGLQQLLCSALLCAALLDSTQAHTLSTRRRGSRARLRSPRTAAVTFSKRQSALHGQVSGGLRNVKGAGSASGDMLYNIGPATTVEQRRPGAWSPGGGQRLETPGLLLAHLPTSHRTIAASTRQGQWAGGAEQRQAQGRAGVAVKSEGNTCTNSRSGGLVWVWLLCAALRCSGTGTGTRTGTGSGSGSLGGWSYFGAQQTCGPDYSP